MIRGGMAKFLCRISFFDPVCWKHGLPTQLIWISPVQQKAEDAQSGTELSHKAWAWVYTFLVLGRLVCSVCYKLTMTLIWLCWCKQDNSKVFLEELMRSLPFSGMKEVRLWLSTT